MNEALKPLLALQECDKHVDLCQREVDELGKDLERLQARKHLAKKTFEDAQKAFSELEAKRRNFASETKNQEDVLIKQKTRQSSLKKQEEYNASALEIQATQAQLRQLEDQELNVLLELDVQKAQLKAIETETQAHLKELDDTLLVLQERRTQHTLQLKTAKELLENAQKHIPAALLSDYLRIKKLTNGRLPVICQLEGEYCRGCQLKVSREIISLLFLNKERVHCDQCGRILYHCY